MNSQPRPYTTVDFLKARGKASSRSAHDASDEQLQRSSSPGHNPSLESAPTKSSKKRYRAPDNEGDSIANTETIKVQVYGTSAPRDFQVRMGSPWGRYREILDLENIHGSVTVAERKEPHYGLVAIKEFPSTAAEKALERHQRVKHENIVDVLDAFTTDTSLYIVLEHLPISLSQIVGGAKYPTEWQLAAILN
ncbi:hypothetical protein B0J14DRAFT_375060 [Halenospora varia]|nr:hypothetical protein B0J14DRAFT_375060 [Halenospora varia]